MTKTSKKFSSCPKHKMERDNFATNVTWQTLVIGIRQERGKAWTYPRGILQLLKHQVNDNQFVYYIYTVLSVWRKKELISKVKI